MRRPESTRAAAARWAIATPSPHDRLPGVDMAGFRDLSTDLVDLRVVPYPAVTVVVDFGDGVLVDDADGRQRRGSVVLGLAPGGVRVSGRDIECLQVRLSPPVARAVLGDFPGPGSAALPLEDLWGRDAVRLRERLRDAASWDDRFAIARAALAPGRGAGPGVDPEVGHVWRRMVDSRGRLRVEPLATEVGWSRKRLWSRFGAQIGLTPKRAAQLVRFDHAAHLLAAGHSASLVAVESGYADQSHLHRDVMAFAGVTPTAVAAAPWLAVDDVAWAAPEHPARR
ncbi:helix-turn-helix domain-containing protein [Streptomyces sp. NPDC050504]|uniref:helix-turn-helix domain-containing protein n=1 Tax=Streptomyces sp. NPDC050504 TaxID=3365618 RepID=UPI0037B56E55